MNQDGIVMQEEGINIIRAVAYSDRHLTSDIFTSGRFYVIRDPNDMSKFYTEAARQRNMADKNWWTTVPRISVQSLGVGCYELSWNMPDQETWDLISHYQILLNKVSYKQFIAPDCCRVMLKGLSGGRNYDLTLMCYPKSQSLMPQQSNTLVCFSRRFVSSHK